MSSLGSRPCWQLFAISLFVLAALGGGAYYAWGERAEESEPDAPELTRGLLDESIDLALQHMLAVQKPRGDFVYEFDYITNEDTGGNNTVRQAGGLWGLASLHRYAPSEESREAVLKGIRFFAENSRVEEGLGRFVVYPNSRQGATGMQALVSLSEIEFLRVEPEGEVAEEVAGYLQGHLEFLLTLQLADGRFFSGYDPVTGAGEGPWSPYYDGEAMLALARAAAYLSREDLVPAVMQAAEGTWGSYVVLPAETDDEKTPKQFYQWGSMAYYEIYHAGWDGSEPYAERAITMARRQIGRMKQVENLANFNYASAYEGLAVAWELAQLTGDAEAGEEIGAQVREGISNLLTFQVGNQQENAFIRANPPASERAIGGCLPRAENPNLRIDFVQHQAHAMLLTREFLFRQP